MQEVWKAIAGYEGIYEVSDQGRIRSVPRRVLNGNGMRDVGGKILKDRFDKGGYKIIDLRRGHEVKTLKVHRLVAAAFIPNESRRSEWRNLYLRGGRCMNKLQDFVDFLNSEELDALKKSMDVEWVRKDMEHSTAEEAAKEAVKWVMHYYVGMDRAFVITNDQQKRWHVVQTKAEDLGLI